MSIFSPQIMLGYLFSMSFLHAAFMTVWISLVALFMGMVLGLIAAAAQEAPWRPVRWLVLFYL